MEPNTEFDPQTKKRITEHYSNYNDVITDADIENVRTEFTKGEIADASNIANEKAAQIDLDPNNAGEIKTTDTPIETPWNVIN